MEREDQSPLRLRDVFSPELLLSFAGAIQEEWPDFPVSNFQKLVFDDKWEELELKERVRHISHCLQRSLPPDYRQALAVLVRTTQALIEQHGEKMTFEYIFIPDFVEQYGLDAREASIAALEEITRWTSAEFAVRPFLLRYPESMYQQMEAWSRHDSPYVRRLASEGFRPRLPWGNGIPVLKKDPSVILPVLEQLKRDPAETVRRSVANNLNDISKDHPELVLEIAANWLGTHPDTDWIVRHACRGLLKKGHPAALRLFGFEPDLSTIVIEDFTHDPSVSIGERFHFAFTLKHAGNQESMIRLEYAIDYRTAGGKISRKVFKISEFALAPAEERAFVKNQRFQDFTTRRHYPGPHRLDLLVNGQVAAGGTFQVLPASG